MSGTGDPAAGEAPASPALTFEWITFSDGTTIKLDRHDIVILTGPNNAGKSAALRDLYDGFGKMHESVVIKATGIRKTGSAKEFVTWLDSRSFIKLDRNDRFKRSGFGFSIEVSGGNANASNYFTSVWDGNVKSLRDIFCYKMDAGTRLNGCAPANAIPVLDEVPQHPFHVLCNDVSVELKASEYFQRAFGLHLFLFRLGGSKIPLLVGKEIKAEADQGRLSVEYNRRLRDSALPLTDQGDGMKSFATILVNLLATGGRSIILLDEPEAFLHPPQARLIGEIIASEQNPNGQLFIATHSSDFLHGVLAAAGDRIRILRIERDGSINRVKELNKERTKELITDPIMRFSSVLDGLFHERAIICESDADCLFYSALLALPSIHGERDPDVMFLHSSGKHRMVHLAQVLHSLGVRTDIIADIDILREPDLVKTVVCALGGSWDHVKDDIVAIKKSVEECKPRLSQSEIVREIGALLSSSLPEDDYAAELKKRVLKVFRQSSPWEAVKDGGKTNLPKGHIRNTFSRLAEYLGSIGLWVVPNGELESFCPSVGNKGPKFVQEVLMRDLENDPGLSDARKFVTQIWSRKFDQTLM